MIEDSQVEDALSILTKKELETYISLKNSIRKVNVSKDSEFQRKYNRFFGVRQRNEKFYDKYYKYMQRNKNNKKLTFEKVLRYISDKKTKRKMVEASFASKMLAIIDVKKPVLDKFVVKNLKDYENIDIKTASPSDFEKRIQRKVTAYKKICNWYDNLLEPARKKKWIELFDKSFPEFKNKITDVKKIDLILWKIR